MLKTKKILLYSLCLCLFFACTSIGASNIFLGIAVASCLYIVYKEKRWKEIYQHDIFRYLIAFWFALIISSLFSENIPMGLKEALKVYANRMLPFFMVMFIAKKDLQEKGKWLLWSGIGSLFVTSLVAIWQFTHGIDRPWGLSSHHMRLASFYAVYMPLILLVIMDSSFVKNSKEKLLLCFTALISFIGFIVNNTRGVWLAVAIVSFVLIGVLGMRNKRVLAGGLAALLVFGCIVCTVPKFKNRVNSTIRAMTDTRGGKKVTDGRWYIWRGAANMIKDKPIFGHGPGSFEKAYNEKYIPKESKEKGLAHAHNIYLHLWSECGIISLIAFLVLMFKMLFDGFKGYFSQHSVYGLMIASIILSIMLQGMTEFNANTFKIGFMLMGYCYLMMKWGKDN